MALDVSTLSNAQLAQSIYIMYFGRAAEPEGLNFWTNFIADAKAEGSSNLDVSVELADRFADEQEAQDRFPFLGDAEPTEAAAADFVNSIYQALFGRDAEGTADDTETGLGFYTQNVLTQLENGEPIGDLILDILVGAQNEDLTEVNNKIEAAESFTNTIANTEGLEYDIDVARQLISDTNENTSDPAQAGADAANTLDDPRLSVSTADSVEEGNTAEFTVSLANADGFDSGARVTESTIQIAKSGANIQDGETVSVDIGGTTVTATFSGDQDASGIAQALATQIANLDGVASANASSNEITVTAAGSGDVEATNFTDNTSANVAANLTTVSSDGSTDLTVDYAVSFEGGASGADHGTPTLDGSDVGTTGTLTFAAGETEKVISIPIKSDQETPESGEGITLTLSDAAGNVVVSGNGAATVDITDVPPQEGNTFTLTANSDIPPDFKGTPDQDTFQAPVVQDGAGALVDTLQSVDELIGGDGFDTLNAVINGGGAAPSIDEIETTQFRFTGTVGVDLVNTNDIENVAVNNSTAAGTINNATTADKITVSNQVQNVTFDGAAIAAAALDLNFDEAGNATTTATVDLGATNAPAATTANISTTDSVVKIDSTGGAGDAFETLTVDASGDSTLTLTDSGATVKDATVTGDGMVTFATQFTGDLKTFDASDNSGGVTANFDSTKAVEATGGTGADSFDMDTGTESNTTVDLGKGDDTLFAGALIGKFTNADGGDGTDIINITDGSTLTKANADLFENFETLDVSGGTGNYDLSLEGFDTVQIDQGINGKLTGAVDLQEAPDDFQFNVISDGTNATFALDKAQTVTLADATGTTAGGDAETVTVDVEINDPTADNTVKGDVQFSTSTTINGVETIAVDSTVTTEEDADDKTATDYTTTFDNLKADSIETLTISGDSDVVFTTLTNGGNTLTNVNATGSTGDITLDVSAVTTQVAYKGSEGTDNYTATDGGSIIGNEGNDQITLEVTAAGPPATGQNTDTLIYQSADDVTLADSNNDGKIDNDPAETVFNFLTASSASGGAQSDLIDLTSFDFSGFAASAVNKGALANAPDGGNFDTEVTDFFADAGGDRGAAIGTNGGNSYLFVDADENGDFNADGDLVVEVNGVTDFTVNDLVF